MEFLKLKLDQKKNKPKKATAEIVGSVRVKIFTEWTKAPNLV